MGEVYRKGNTHGRQQCRRQGEQRTLGPNADDRPVGGQRRVAHGIGDLEPEPLLEGVGRLEGVLHQVAARKYDNVDKGN